MLFSLGSWILLATCGVTIGGAILAITKCSGFPHFGDRVIMSTWLGLITISTTLLALSLIVPLSPVIGSSLLLILTIVALSIDTVRRDLGILLQYLKSPVSFGLGVLAVISALNSTRLVEAYDTGLYHYQQTRWLAEYGTLPGLALIVTQFGSSSSWFALAAPLDFGPFQGRISGSIGGLAIFLCLVHFTLATTRILQRRSDRADWFLVGGYALIFLVCFSWAFEVSLSPDVPVWILTMLIGWTILTADPPGAMPRSPHGFLLPLILAFGAITIKLSAAPTVVIAAIFYWFKSAAKWSTRLVLAFLVSLIAFPTFIANFVSSGCPLFPNSILCIDVPWGYGKAAARQAAADIVNWARWGGPAPARATAWNWMLPWILHLDKLLLISFCAACLIGFVISRSWRVDKSLVYVLGLALAGTVFVFINAPNPRFGAGYLALYPALFLAAVGPHLEGWGLGNLRTFKGPALLASSLVGVAVVVGAQGCLRELSLRRNLVGLEGLHMSTDLNLNRLLLPPALPRYSGDLVVVRSRRVNRFVGLELTTERSNGIEYHRPLTTDQCWGVALPCLPTSLKGDVQLRYPGNGFRSGFARSPN